MPFPGWSGKWRENPTDGLSLAEPKKEFIAPHQWLFELLLSFVVDMLGEFAQRAA